MRVSYLVRHRSGSLYFRYVVPSRLRPIFGREIRIALNIALKSEAAPIAFRLASQAHQFFNEICSMSLLVIPESRLRQIARDYFKREVQQEYQIHVKRKSGLTPSAMRSLLSELYSVQRDCDENLCRGDYRPALESAEELLESEGYDELTVAEHSSQLARTIMQERPHFVDALVDMYSNSTFSSDDVDKHFGATIASDVSQLGSEILLLDVIRSYMLAKKQRNEWVKKTFKTTSTILNRFNDVISSYLNSGSVRMSDLNQQVMNEYLVKMVGPDYTFSPKTLDNNMIAVRSFMNWCEEEGYVNNVKALNKKLKLPKHIRDSANKKTRSAFTEDDLHKLFNSPMYLRDKHQSAAKHWIPVIGLYTGARVEEIAQLSLSDIKVENNIYFFHVNDEGEKSTKTEASKRYVPIHPVLIEVGLVNRIEYLKSIECSALFPELQRRESTDMLGGSISQWFTRYRRKCGVEDLDVKGKNRVFHSFRRTVVTLLRKSGVGDNFLKPFIGHDKEENITDLYDDNEVSIEQLYASVVLKLNFSAIPVDVLKKSKWIYKQ